MVRRRRRFGTDSDGQAERCRGAPMRSAPVVWVGWEAVDQNQPACGGAREGGNREGAARASLVSRWVRGVVQGCTGYGPKDGIFLITAGSSMQAMIRSAPPQAGQVSMSMPKTRFSRCAHVIAMDGMYAGFAGAKTGHCCSAFRWRFLLSLLEGFGFGSLPPLPWCHRGATSTVAPRGHKGANTPWKRVKLTRGLGTRAASRAMTCMDALMPQAQDAQAQDAQERRSRAVRQNRRERF